MKFYFDRQSRRRNHSTWRVPSGSRGASSSIPASEKVSFTSFRRLLFYLPMYHLPLDGTYVLSFYGTHVPRDHRTIMYHHYIYLFQHWRTSLLRRSGVYLYLRIYLSIRMFLSTYTYVCIYLYLCIYLSLNTYLSITAYHRPINGTYVPICHSFYLYLPMYHRPERWYTYTTVSPDLPKFLQFGTIITVFGNLLDGVFGIW